MNRIPDYLLRVALASLILLLPAFVFAQEGRIQINQLDKLAQKASEVVDVTLDESLLRLASGFIPQNEPNAVAIKGLVEGLKGVYVKVYEFDADNAYTQDDLNSIRSQLTGPGWSRIVGVRNKKGENVDVFLMGETGKIKGLVVLAAEPRELAVINIVGPISIENLKMLQGKFGIPNIDFGSQEQPKKETKP